MKNTLLGLLALTMLFSACSKNDGDNDPQHNWQLSRIMMDHDTVRFSYNADGTIKQVNEYGSDAGSYSDSLQIIWQNGKISAINEYEGGVAQPDMVFVYTGDQVKEIQHYRDGVLSGAVDSIVYKDNKISEIHYFNNEGVRSYYHKLTWTGNNVTRDEYYAYNFDGTGILTLQYITDYTYSDKPSIGKLAKGDALFWFTMEIVHLSENAVVTSVTVDSITDEGISQSAYTYTYDAGGLLESSKETENDLVSDETTVYNAKFDYIDLK
ncbi:hypothetical protein [Chitinophaga sp. XS-30]|uniref:hypothetical protein n=1 Tax=Chitinophaga sp. XS-30 TaxID=2604421 RepID=UPI0011DC86A0|nr:hypothetical protein [Chitinophaga sp. XS-30]QEH41085.1 hypothetical protein FW415_09455 [Chitinophaga sp. XS-30]